MWEPAPAGLQGNRRPEEFTMWPATQHPSIPPSYACSDADALFVSALQRSETPNAGQIRQAIASALGFVAGICGRSRPREGSSLKCHRANGPSPSYGGAGSRASMLSG